MTKLFRQFLYYCYSDKTLVFIYFFLQILRFSHSNIFMAFGTLYLYTLCILIITSQCRSHAYEIMINNFIVINYKYFDINVYSHKAQLFFFNHILKQFLLRFFILQIFAIGMNWVFFLYRYLTSTPGKFNSCWVEKTSTNQFEKKPRGTVKQIRVY